MEYKFEVPKNCTWVIGYYFDFLDYWIHYEVTMYNSKIGLINVIDN